MADRKQQRETRIFVKKVGDETLTREVTSAQAEVEARFDGFTEQAPAKSSTSAASAGSRPAAGAST